MKRGEHHYVGTMQACYKGQWYNIVDNTTKGWLIIKVNSKEIRISPFDREMQYRERRLI